MELRHLEPFGDWEDLVQVGCFKFLFIIIVNIWHSKCLLQTLGCQFVTLWHSSRILLCRLLFMTHIFSSFFERQRLSCGVGEGFPRGPWGEPTAKAEKYNIKEVITLRYLCASSTGFLQRKVLSCHILKFTLGISTQSSCRNTSQGRTKDAKKRFCFTFGDCPPPFFPICWEFTLWHAKWSQCFCDVNEKGALLQHPHLFG